MRCRFATRTTDGDGRNRHVVQIPASPTRCVSMMETVRFGAWRTGSAATFRLWAPALATVSIDIDGEPVSLPMAATGGGWFEHRADLPFGTRYRYRSPDGLTFPDPASRQQKGGVHGWSVLTDSAYSWRCGGWCGRPWRETVLYEIHPGLAGGFAGIAAELPRLAQLGVTAVELMPIADFPGERSWGYDGVLPFAPAAAYAPITSAEGFLPGVFHTAVGSFDLTRGVSEIPAWRSRDLPPPTSRNP